MALTYSPPVQSAMTILRMLLYDIAKRCNILYDATSIYEIKISFKKGENAWLIDMSNYTIAYLEEEATIIVKSTHATGTAPIVTYDYPDILERIINTRYPAADYFIRSKNHRSLISYANTLPTRSWIHWILLTWQFWHHGKQQDNLFITLLFENGKRIPTFSVTNGAYTIQQEQTQIFGDLFHVTYTPTNYTRRMICPETYSSLNKACKACFS